MMFNVVSGKIIYFYGPWVRRPKAIMKYQQIKKQNRIQVKLSRWESVESQKMAENTDRGWNTWKALLCVYVCMCVCMCVCVLHLKSLHVFTCLYNRFNFCLRRCILMDKHGQARMLRTTLRDGRGGDTSHIPCFRFCFRHFQPQREWYLESVTWCHTGS